MHVWTRGWRTAHEWREQAIENVALEGSEGLSLSSIWARLELRTDFLKAALDEVLTLEVQCGKQRSRPARACKRVFASQEEQMRSLNVTEVETLASSDADVKRVIGSANHAGRALELMSEGSSLAWTRRLLEEILRLHRAVDCPSLHITTYNRSGRKCIETNHASEPRSKVGEIDSLCSHSHRCYPSVKSGN